MGKERHIHIHAFRRVKFRVRSGRGKKEKGYKKKVECEDIDWLCCSFQCCKTKQPHTGNSPTPAFRTKAAECADLKHISECVLSRSHTCILTAPLRMAQTRASSQSPFPVLSPCQLAVLLSFFFFFIGAPLDAGQKRLPPRYEKGEKNKWQTHRRAAV